MDRYELAAKLREVADTIEVGDLLESNLTVEPARNPGQRRIETSINLRARLVEAKNAVAAAGRS